MFERPRVVGILATFVLPVVVVVVRTSMNVAGGGEDGSAVAGLFLAGVAAAACAGCVAVLTLIRHGDLGRHGRMSFLDYVESGLAAVIGFIVLSVFTKTSLNRNGRLALVVLACATIALYLLVLGRSNFPADGN